ncbi:hypothetical protein AAG570_008568 [Ranatra chinensis]|uniref:Uncharacterized protein n=1 Tax=Ranatra chinensis TaxID=642074 RepID=A0ABD0YRK7_9HEMI
MASNCRNMFYQNKKQEKTEIADIQKFMRREIPTSEEGKCMIACIMKKTDAMTDDGKLSVEGMRKGVAVMAKKNKIKQETVETAYQVIDKCTNQVSGTTGDCETAFKFATCFKERAHEMGLVSPDHGHV